MYVYICFIIKIIIWRGREKVMYDVMLIYVIVYEVILIGVKIIECENYYLVIIFFELNLVVNRWYYMIILNVI